MVVIMELDLHVTNRCNLLCAHCIYDANHKKMDDVTIDTVKRILPSMKRMQVKEVHLTGGEPLVNPDLYDMISILKDNEFVIRLQSNGILMTDDTVARLKKLAIDSVLISIDGLEEAHNFLRNNSNSYQYAQDAIKRCLNAGIFTRVNTVLHKKNINDIANLMERMQEIGVNEHSFFYLSPGGRGTAIKHLMLSLKEWKEAEDTIKRCAKRLGCSERVKYQNLLVDTDQCENRCRIEAKDNCLLLANGDVYPCVFFVNSEYCLGNIYQSKLDEIWNNNQLWEQYHPTIQKSCDNKNCGGGCIGMAYLLNKDIHSCDSRCRPNEYLIPGCIRRYIEKEDHETNI